ncbi:MAG: hypothetical protein PW788_09340 [Micavibrio sp.]|nr:hypothetical protein [Micavibrio sp.]
MFETFDDIVKAQGIYQKMVAEPQSFKKFFTEAIKAHSLDEFYPVVVRAELSAALSLSAKAREQDNGFDFREYLYKSFGLRPYHLVNVSTQTIADIMERDLREVEDLFRAFDYTVENGMVTSHPDAGKAPKIVSLDAVREKKAAGNAG